MKFLRFQCLVTLVLVALFMGLEFAHALELPVKLQYNGTLYITIQNSLYRHFGAPGPGAFVTVGAVLAAIALTVLLRKQQPAFAWALAGMLCLAIANSLPIPAKPELTSPDPLFPSHNAQSFPLKPASHPA